MFQFPLPHKDIFSADRHEKCRLFKENNGCVTSPGWMIVNCPISCDACHLRDHRVCAPTLTTFFLLSDILFLQARCTFDHLNMSSTPAFQPGQINGFFESILNEYEIKYDILVYSMSPWIIMLDNFMTETETTALISVKHFSNTLIYFMKH